jgi:glucose/arabinose dehydrogenase
VFETAQQKVKVSVVAPGIPHPFSLLILPNGDMLVSGAGRLHAIRRGQLDPQPVAGVPKVHFDFHAGLLDFAAHTKCAENQLIYFTYHKQLPVPEEYAITLARPCTTGSA